MAHLERPPGPLLIQYQRLQARKAQEWGRAAPRLLAEHTSLQLRGACLSPESGDEVRHAYPFPPLPGRPITCKGQRVVSRQVHDRHRRRFMKVEIRWQDLAAISGHQPCNVWWGRKQMSSISARDTGNQMELSTKQTPSERVLDASWSLVAT